MTESGRADALHLSRLTHRGPDAVGEWRHGSGACWLGHVRLAILELSSAGHQPMVSANGRFVIVFNGEIYNHLELRRELNSPASGWRGMSDTETLLEAFCQWGEGVVERLSGMFAFSIYDTQHGGLFAAVDRFGMKPFYFRKSHGSFQACSESRLLARGDNEVSIEALAGYLQWGCLPPGTSMWKDIRMLEPGLWMRVGRDLKVVTGRYWPQKLSKSGPREGIKIKQTVKGLVEAAVERHLLSNVPVAAFLSGGIDSSIVATVAAKKLGHELQTFCLSFADRSLDESKIAQMVATKAGVTHNTLLITESEAVAMVPKAVECMDSPSVDAVNTYLVAAKVREHGIKVALSGLGGDELFGGYPSFSDTAALSRLATVPQALRNLLGSLSGKMARIRDLPGRDVPTLARWRRSKITRQEARAAGLPDAAVEPLWGPGLRDSFAEISWQELFGYASPMLLRDSDQMSMAVSLEIRVPFLDSELVEYVLGLPSSVKQGARPKQLLIDAFKQDLPVEVWERPKQGFELPMDAWMRGPLHGFVKDGFNRLLDLRLLNEEFLQKKFSDFNARRIHWTRLWSLVILGHYLARNRGF